MPVSPFFTNSITPLFVVQYTHLSRNTSPHPRPHLWRRVRGAQDCDDLATRAV